MTTPMNVHDFEATSIDGAPVSLASYAGKTLLIVNVASQCGLTPQYKGLEALYRAYKDRGLVVLGFPCDQFGHQEPGSESEIKDFCATRFEVTFPLFAKVDVNGPQAHPLFKYLREQKPDVIKWNFNKFLVDGEGRVVERFEPTVTPEAIADKIAPLFP